MIYFPGFGARSRITHNHLYTYNANLFALSEEGGRTDDPRQKVYKIKELANSRDQVLEPQVGT